MEGDREHIRNTIVGERYQEVVTAAIKESKALQELQHKLPERSCNRPQSRDQRAIPETLDADRNIAGLLTDRDPVITLPSSGAGEKGADAGDGLFDGKYSPTFLLFEEKLHEKPLALPINRSRPVSARTDAENGYLQRADNTGHLLIAPSIYARFGVRAQLHDGRLTLFLDPVAKALKVGDEIALKVAYKTPRWPSWPRTKFVSGL